LDGSFHVTRPRPELLALGVTVRVAGHDRLVVRRAGTDQRPILRLEGCDDRSAAERLRGERLLRARGEAPPLEPDEWWAEDLEGCAVHDGDRTVGTVRRLLGLPSCEVLEIERGDGAADLLVPFIHDAVRSVDIAGQTIDIDLAFLGET
jgi:16S rRNA processing protein RimM